MITSPSSHQWRRSVIGLGILFLVPAIALRAFSQDSAKPEPEPAPATSADSDTAPSAPVVDLRTLVLREQGTRTPGESVLSVRGKSDGTVEVRDASGNLIQTYPLSHFSVSGKVSSTAIEKVNASEEVLQKGLTERKEKEKAEVDKAAEETRKAETSAKEQEKANEVKWQEDLKAKSTSYLDRKTNSKVNAVKIDAREIREDGTYLYEGKALKPVRLFNKERSRYEMAIPVPESAK